MSSSTGYFNDVKTYEFTRPAQSSCLLGSIPSASRRYDTTANVTQKNIPTTGLNKWSSEPQSIPEWSSHINPEGKRYHRHAKRSLITDSDMLNLVTRRLAESYADEFETSLAQSETSLPEGSEIYLEIDTEEDTCRYYVANHRHCSIGWLSSVQTHEELGLPEVHSETHLETKLNEEYWLHVEYFPMHYDVPQSEQDRLVGQLVFSCADSMTSQGTTSPYPAGDCERFLRLIDQAPKHSGERTWLIARLSNQLARSRFINYYGEDAARLDRSQSIHFAIQEASVWLGRFSKCLLFNTPAMHQSRLEALWVDRIIYVQVWQHTMRLLVAEQRDTILLAIVIWLASLASLFLPFTDSISLYVLAMITMMLSFASTVSAAIMIHTHRSRVDDTATEATAYLNAAEHAQYGLQPLSIILSIPSSLLSWSLLTSSLSIIIMILGHQDLPVKIALSCLWVIVAHFITTVVRFFKFSR